MIRPIVDIAKDVRKQLKERFPGCTFSVTVRSSRSLTVALMAAPFQPFMDACDGYAQLNHYTIQRAYDDGRQAGTSNGYRLTPEAWQVLSEATRIANAENWDRSDSQFDHFDVNYYFDLAIGKWDKPFATN